MFQRGVSAFWGQAPHNLTTGGETLVDDILDVFCVCGELRRTDDATLPNAAHPSAWDGW